MRVANGRRGNARPIRELLRHTPSVELPVGRQVSWLAALSSAAFPANPSIHQWPWPTLRCLQLRGQLRHRDSHPLPDSLFVALLRTG